MNEIWVTRYIFTPLTNQQARYTGYIVAWAKDLQNYLEKVQQFCAKHQLAYDAQQSPLPVLTWFEQYGFSAQLFYITQTLSQFNQIAILKEKDLPLAFTENEDEYLIQTNTNFQPFTDIFIEQAVPTELGKDFFYDFIEADTYTTTADVESTQTVAFHYYAIVDCAKVMVYPDQLKLVGRLANLYQGKMGQMLEDYLPHLVELETTSSGTVKFLQSIFLKMDNEVFSHWKSNPVIFLKSRQNFDAIYHHLRKFTRLKDPDTEKWYNFRFYDPTVLKNYLYLLRSRPANLASFFGVNNGVQLIDSFGVRIENEFFTFKLTSLPENQQPAKIEFDKYLHLLFREMNWKLTKNNLISKTKQYFPETPSLVFEKWLDQCKNKNIFSSPQAYWFYLCGRVFAEKNNWDYFAMLDICQQETKFTNIELTEKLMNELLEKDNQNV